MITKNANALFGRRATQSGEPEHEHSLLAAGDTCSSSMSSLLTVLTNTRFCHREFTNEPAG